MARELHSAEDAAAAISWVLEDGRDDVLLAGEILLAGHTMSELRPVSLEVWDALHGGLAAHLPEGMAWYVATK